VSWWKSRGQRHEGVRGSGCTTTLILDLDTAGGQVATSTIRPLYTWGMGSRRPLIIRLGDPWIWALWRTENLWSPPDIEAQLLRCPTQSLAIYSSWPRPEFSCTAIHIGFVVDVVAVEHILSPFFPQYRGADKSLARPGRKQATVTEDFDYHISYL
jgi:hypothetical protein